MISQKDILETITMIQDENLDVRTITLGISLLDCCGSDIDAVCDKIYDKITSRAKNLVKTAAEIEKEFGIPIINKRISVTPISLVLASCENKNAVKIALTLEKAGRECGIDFIGGFGALVEKGFSHGDRELINSIPEALSITDHVCSSVNVGSTKTGINMDAVKLMGEIVLKTALATADKNSIGAAKLVIFCNAVPDNPFMAGAFHGAGEPDCVLNIGVSGPGAVRAALAKSKNLDLTGVADLIKRTAFKVTRMGQLVGSLASQRLGYPFGIVDLSLAPTPAAGDSVARILEEMGLSRCGSPGTTAALAILNDAVKKGGSFAASNVGGLSGAFIPVSEDEGMIEAVKNNALSIEKLEAMTAVCSVGLDMIAVPGDVDPYTISGIIADETAIGMVNSKTTAVRLIPAIGKKEGETLDLGGLLGSAPVMGVNRNSPKKFIDRKGRIPAPLQSLKN